MFAVETTEDGRWLVITAFKGASDRSEVFRLDRRDHSIAPLFTTFEHAGTFVGDADGRLFFITDDHAPRGRMVSVDPNGDGAAVEVVPEGPDKITGAAIAGRTLARLPVDQRQ